MREGVPESRKVISMAEWKARMAERLGPPADEPVQSPISLDEIKDYVGEYAELLEQIADSQKKDLGRLETEVRAGGKDLRSDIKEKAEAQMEQMRNAIARREEQAHKARFLLSRKDAERDELVDFLLDSE